MERDINEMLRRIRDAVEADRDEAGRVRLLLDTLLSNLCLGNVSADEIKRAWDGDNYIQGLMASLKPPPESTRVKRLEEAASALDHAANEWAGAFYNAQQHIRNIREGVTEPEPALDNLRECAAHCQLVWDEARKILATEPRTQPTERPMTKWTHEGLASQADTHTITGLMPAGETRFYHDGQAVMVFHPNGRLEFPLFGSCPDSVKDAASVLCEHVSTAHKSLATENVRLRTALWQAGAWFADYAEMHRAKGADDKAARNQERADFCARHAGGDNV